jgi:apolipoprotein N-acyltransferase
MKLNGQSRLALCAVAGLVLPLAFAPFGYWPIAVLCLAGLFHALAGSAPKQMFYCALIFGLLSFLGGTYWTFISVTVFYGAPAVLGIAAMIGLVVALALFFAVLVAIASRYISLAGVPGKLLVLPALWVLAEWCRSWMFSGFGWLSAGYSQSDTWLMSYAPVVGVYGVSYAVALSAGTLLVIMAWESRSRMSALMTLVAVWGFAFLLDGWRWTQPRPELVNVAIVQAAIPQDQKWRSEQYLPTLQTYRRLSLQTSGRDLIVWPEVAVPNLFSYARDFLEGVQREIAMDGGTLVTGVLLRHEDGKERNAVVAMTPEPQFFAKQHLVPFGEYLPLPEFALQWLREFGVPFPDIGAGLPEQPLLVVAGQSLAVSICYEDVFGAEQLAFFPQASLVVNVANDAWFGESIAAAQHLQIARVRAAEVGRYVLRATNTGVSAIINPLGDVIEAGPSFEPAVLSATVQGFTGATPYVRWGNIPIVATAVIITGVAGFRIRRRG